MENTVPFWMAYTWLHTSEFNEKEGRNEQKIREIQKNL